MRWPVRIQGGTPLILMAWPPPRRLMCVVGRLTALRRAAGLRWATTTLLLLALTAQAALAQQASRIPRIGILSPYAVSASSFHDDVKRGLTDLGYVERTTVVYETRFADGHAVEQGFVASLAKPGGNVTGTSWLNVELSEKRLELLKQALPGLSRVAVLREAVGAGATARAAMTAAQALGLQVYILEVRDPNELEDAFSEMDRIGVAALSVFESPMITAEGRRIAHLALRHRIPAIFPDRSFLEAGGLMSYGPSLPRMYRQAATYIHRIITGARPAELPVEQPTLFALVVSQRFARFLGLSLSETILVRADEIIE